jgi:hypothetical protein
MENSSLYPLSILRVKNIIFDLIALVAIYLVPAVSHLLSFPLYYLEPMRIMLILAIVHTSRRNAYLIAITLPIFSLLLSAHPSVIKTSLITGELLINLWLFFFLSGKLTSKGMNLFLSIIASKLLYYLIKFLLINSALMDGQLFSTPIYIQLVMLAVFSGYVYLTSLDKGK